MSFKVGDRIVCVSAEPTNWYENGDEYTVRGEPFIPRGSDEFVVHVEEQTQNAVWVNCNQFELVEDEDQSIQSHNFDDDAEGWKLNKNGEFSFTNQPFIVDGEQVYIDQAFIDQCVINSETSSRLQSIQDLMSDFSECISQTELCTDFSDAPLGVARPILETRKVGKVQQHMVEDGFPNALREIAEVLTWAAEVKQYKLHDWKNLPNAEVEFPSAGYRHKSDNSIQKAAGLKALERVDHESNKLHLAHECFNKLAELELVLTGVIK